MTDGCDIINASDNINLWRKLTYANVKVIGRRDLLKIVFEAGELSYPEDYPDTHSYQLYIKQVKNKNILKFRNRPKNRRVNYIKLHSPFPFGPNFDILSKNQPFLDSYTRVQLAMLGRGVPNKFSYICLPIQEDIETAKELIASERNSGVTHVHTEVEDSADMDVESVDLKGIQTMSDQELELHFASCITSRRIIGFATTGDYSYRLCRGFCNGYVLREF
jgi:hypothetical protein